MTERDRGPTFVSVIIPAYNAGDTIAEQLRALEEQTYQGDWEILVADNASKDDTAAVVESWRTRLPQLRLVEATAGQGPGYARNVAVDAAKGDLLAFCDADDAVDRRWLETLVRASPSADALGGRLAFDRLNEPDVARWREGDIPDDQLMVILDFLPFSVTANLAVWRDAFDAAGGFAPFETAGEDVEFCWRLQLAGCSLTYVPEAVVHHRYRSDLRSLVRQYHAYGIAQARLYRDFRAHGAKRRSLVALAKTWVRLALEAPWALWDPVARGRWLRRVAYEAGHLRGAWRYRVLFAG